MAPWHKSAIQLQEMLITEHTYACNKFAGTETKYQTRLSYFVPVEGSCYDQVASVGRNHAEHLTQVVSPSGGITVLLAAPKNVPAKALAALCAVTVYDAKTSETREVTICHRAQQRASASAFCASDCLLPST